MKQDHKSVKREDYENALKQIDTFVDVSVDQLMTIAEIAKVSAYKREIEQVLIKDLMTSPVISAHSNDSLTHAVHLLTTHKFSGLPVVDETEKLVGLLSETDFLPAIGIPVNHASHTIWHSLESIFIHGHKVIKPTGVVSDIMTRELVTVDLSQSIHDLIYSLKKNKVRRVVVCDEQENVVGIVSQSDLIQLFFERFIAHY